jgi:hypothetical protein
MLEVLEAVSRSELTRGDHQRSAQTWEEFAGGGALAAVAVGWQAGAANDRRQL